MDPFSGRSTRSHHWRPRRQRHAPARRSLYERWAGERLVIESAVPSAKRVGRPISVSAVPFGPGIDLWRSQCAPSGTLIAAILRSLLFVSVLGCLPCHIPLVQQPADSTTRR